MNRTSVLIWVFLFFMTVALPSAVVGAWASGIPVAAGVSVTATMIAVLAAAYILVLD